MKKVGTYKKHSIYQDQNGTLGVRKGDFIVTLMRQLESGRFIPMTYSDFFMFKERGNFDEATKDLADLQKRKVCKECWFEENNGHAQTCSKRKLQVK